MRGRGDLSRRAALARLAGPALFVALTVPGTARAQERPPETLPSPLPQIPQDEKDFQGRSSVTLGSGARAFGMGGGAFLARADDATAASWNPAGLSYLRRPEVSIVGARNAFDTEPASTTPIGVTDTFRGYTPDFAAFAYPVSVGSVSGAVQLSFQRVFPFQGNRTVDRPDFDLLSDGSGGFDVLALGTGLQVSRHIRLGATLNRWFNGYRQDRERTGQRRSQSVLEYEGLSGWNANLGLIASPWESLNLGAVIKTPFTADLTLRRRRMDYQVPFSIDPATITENAAGRDDLEIDFPLAVGVGASWRPRSTLTLSVDYTRTNWSDGRIRNFFTLAATPLGGSPPPPEVFPLLPYPTLDDPIQNDTTQVRTGVEYVFIRAAIKIPVRAGYFTDKQYFRGGDGKAPSYDGLAFGLGVLAGPFLIDAAYVHEWGSFIDTDPLQTRVSVRIRRLFASVIYRFGSR